MLSTGGTLGALVFVIFDIAINVRNFILLRNLPLEQALERINLLPPGPLGFCYLLMAWISVSHLSQPLLGLAYMFFAASGAYLQATGIDQRRMLLDSSRQMSSEEFQRLLGVSLGATLGLHCWWLLAMSAAAKWGVSS